MKRERCCSVLKDAPPSLKVKVVDFKSPCLFYRKKGEEFLLDEIIPEGMCPDLFFQIYPQYLSLLYDGKALNTEGRGAAIVKCPGATGKTYWRVGRKKLLLSPMINLAEKLFRLIGMPKDFIDKKIVVTLQGVEGECPKEYSRPLSFSFNQYSHLWGRRFFCPAVFYTLYPFLKAFVADPAVESSTFQCPADNSSIAFKFTK